MTGIWYVIGFAFAGVSFVFLTIAAAWLVSHRNRGDVHKGLPYESGIDTYGDTHGRFGLSFYIYALLFVAFDIEVIFIYLWAIAFDSLLLGGLVSMLIFVGILLLGLGLRLAQGGDDMAVKANGQGRDREPRDRPVGPDGHRLRRHHPAGPARDPPVGRADGPDRRPQFALAGRRPGGL